MSPELFAWQHRDCDWPTEELIGKVKMEKARLSLRIDKQGIGNPEVDMSLAYSLSPLLYHIKGYKKALVIMKDLAADSCKSQDQTLPKSHHIKMAMAWCKQRVFGAKQPSLDVLILETLKFLVQAYEKGYLPSFFDERKNLLIDADPELTRQASEKLQLIIDNPEKHVRYSFEQKMVTSFLLKQFAIEFHEAFPNYFDRVPYLALLFKLGLECSDYSSHKPENAVEAFIDEEFASKLASAVMSNELKSKPTLPFSTPLDQGLEVFFKGTDELILHVVLKMTKSLLERNLYLRQSGWARALTNALEDESASSRLLHLIRELLPLIKK